MKCIGKITVAVLTLMIAAGGVQAHNDLLNPGHMHGLDIRSAECMEFGDGKTAGVTLWLTESSRPCALPVCPQTCVYRVWGDWESGRYTSPNWSKCHITNNHNPRHNRIGFKVHLPWSPPPPEWGVYVKDNQTGETAVKCTR